MFKSGYIAILGAPNAGKSTLLNAILGEKFAAVTDKPQTTRRNFAGIYTTPTSQMIFLDTPGIHTSQKKLNHYMMDQIQKAVADADVLCWLVAADQPLDPILKDMISWTQQKYPHKKEVLAINKIDLQRKARRGGVAPPAIEGEETSPLRPVCKLSALIGEGIKEFLVCLESLLLEGPAYYPEDQLTDQNLRDLAAELIREKVMALTFQEIPYSTAVEILAFKEEPQITRIEATIVVEQESQKGMVIGKGGALIKKIGTLARQDLEKLVGTHVFLELRVKVDKNWTKKPERLAYYGYQRLTSR